MDTADGDKDIETPKLDRTGVNAPVVHYQYGGVEARAQARRMQERYCNVRCRQEAKRWWRWRASEGWWFLREWPASEARSPSLAVLAPTTNMIARRMRKGVLDGAIAGSSGVRLRRSWCGGVRRQ